MFFITQVFIFTYFNGQEFVHCSRDGKRWLIAKESGVFIFSFAIFPCIIGTAVPRAVFIQAAVQSDFYKWSLAKKDDDRYAIQINDK
jgi:hypothetical protein